MECFRVACRVSEAVTGSHCKITVGMNWLVSQVTHLTLFCVHKNALKSIDAFTF